MSKKPPKPKEPWAVRDPSPRGDTTPKGLFTAVGSALTEWEAMEAEYAKIFAILVSANQKRSYQAPAVRAYGSVTSVQGRHKMLELASSAYFATRKQSKILFEPTLENLLKAYIDYSARRNEIAHGSVKSIYLTEKKNNKGHRQPAIGYYLVPSFYNPKKFKDDVFTYRYVESDLIYYRQEFTKLGRRAGGLREKMQRR